MKSVNSKIVSHCWILLAVFFINDTLAIAQKGSNSSKHQRVRKEYKSRKSLAGPSVTNKRAKNELSDSQAMERKKTKGEEKAKEKVNTLNTKPKYKEMVKKKGKSVEKKSIP